MYLIRKCFIRLEFGVNQQQNCLFTKHTHTPTHIWITSVRTYITEYKYNNMTPIKRFSYASMSEQKGDIKSLSHSFVYTEQNVPPVAVVGGGVVVAVSIIIFLVVELLAFKDASMCN